MFVYCNLFLYVSLIEDQKRKISSLSSARCVLSTSSDRGDCPARLRSAVGMAVGCWCAGGWWIHNLLYDLERARRASLSRWTGSRGVGELGRDACMALLGDPQPHAHMCHVNEGTRTVIVCLRDGMTVCVLMTV